MKEDGFMKKRMHSIVTVFLGIFLVSPASVFSVDLQKSNPSNIQAMNPITVPKLQTAPVQSASPSSLHANIPPIPSALQSNIKLAVINQIRQQLGLGPRGRPTTPVSTPFSIVLTPRAPSIESNFGPNYIRFLGVFDPLGTTGSVAIRSLSVCTATGCSDENDCFELCFSTIPGKSYLVDITCDNIKMIWQCRGPFEGSVYAQSGHILLPFTASERQSYLTIAREDRNYSLFAYIYQAELTQVN
jgi:hypothetical protein